MPAERWRHFSAFFSLFHDLCVLLLWHTTNYIYEIAIRIETSESVVLSVDSFTFSIQIDWPFDYLIAYALFVD